MLTLSEWISALQLLATVVGLLVLYFKIARQIGQWEQTQKQTVEELKKHEGKIEKFTEKLGTLAERVYELFGQLKK